MKAAKTEKKLGVRADYIEYFYELIILQWAVGHAPKRPLENDFYLTLKGGG